MFKTNGLRGVMFSGAFGLMMVSTSAMAAEFDGIYDLKYQLLGGSGEVCVDAPDQEEVCHYAALNVVLFDGQITTESVELIASNAIGEVEAASGRDLDPRVEAALYELIGKAFDNVDDQLNAALQGLPAKMDLFQMPRSPSTIFVDFITSSGDVIPSVGTLEAETGNYDVLGLYKGTIDRTADYTGWGVVELPVDQSAEAEGMKVTVRGSAFSSFDSAPEGYVAPEPEPQPEPARGPGALRLR